MSSYVAKNIQTMPPSGIRKFFDVASQMEGLVSLGVGEPDFDTPWNITEAGIYSLEKGCTHYTSNAGLLSLRKEISKYMKKYDLHYEAETEIIISVGASEDIDLALRAVVNPGDEVLVVEPCFVSYTACVTMAGGIAVPVITKEEDNFKLTKEALIANITPKTKAIIMGYPNNPTGAIMERSDLEPIVEVLRDREIVVISDEIYSELTYSDKHHVSIASFEGMRDKTIVINGFSKAFAMTGWRLGFSCGPKEIISAMIKIHQYVIMCAPTVSQYAGIEAMKNGAARVKEMIVAYDGRRRFLLNGLRELGLSCFEPEGTFYVFPSIQSTGISSDEFCEKALFEHKIAVVPGNAFGSCGEGFIRCSYACSLDNLKEAVLRLSRLVDSLKK